MYYFDAVFNVSATANCFGERVRGGSDQVTSDLFRERFDSRAPTLAPSILRVVRFIDANRARALSGSAVEIAALAGTSDATVVRAAQALGFGGLGELKQALASTFDGSSTPAHDMRRTLAEIGVDVGLALDAVLDAHDEALQKLRGREVRAALTAAVSALHPVVRIAVFGIGPSAELAHYAAVPLGRAGRRTLVLDRTGRGLADQMLELRRGDGLLALAYGRPYREIAAVLGEARRLALPAVLLTGDADHQLSPLADVVLSVPRGRAGRVALHGATFVALETLILGLTSTMGSEALASLDRLGALRETIDGRVKQPRGARRSKHSVD